MVAATLTFARCWRRRVIGNEHALSINDAWAGEAGRVLKRGPYTNMTDCEPRLAAMGCILLKIVVDRRRREPCPPVPADVAGLGEAAAGVTGGGARDQPG